MSRLWERITSRGQSYTHQHAQLPSHDEHGAEEDSELEAAFAGSSPAPGDNSTEVVFDAHDGSDRPYDAQEPYESHPLQAAGSSSRRSGDQSSTSSVASGDIYDFDLNPSQMRAAPSSTQTSSAVHNTGPQGGGSAPSYEDPASASHRLRHVITAGLSSLASISRYGRLAQSDPDHHAPSSASMGRQAGMANDGVFANLSAKPERRQRTQEGDIDYVGGDDENGSKEAPPSYDAAALDTTPPYWETTIMAPSGFMGADEVLIEGLPIGNIFSFAWNMLVSMSFQFVGFLLTYLLHTSHAAKHGSRAGLGITLIQYALYLQSRADTLQKELDHGQIPPELIGAFPSYNQTDGTILHMPGDHMNNGGGLFGPPAAEEMATATTTSLLPDGSTPTQPAAPSMLSGLPEMQREGLEQAMEMSSMANDWLSYMLMFIGAALLLGAVLSYYKAWRWAKRIRGDSSGQAPSVAAAASEPLFVQSDEQIQQSLRRAGLM